MPPLQPYQTPIHRPNLLVRVFAHVPRPFQVFEVKWREFDDMAEGEGVESGVGVGTFEGCEGDVA